MTAWPATRPADEPTALTPTVPELLEALRASHRLVEQLATGRAVAPLRWLRRLTGRGPDLAAALAASQQLADLASAPVERIVHDNFLRDYFARRSQTWEDTRWLGTHVLKLPLDLWTYQELLHETRPDVIIECGTKHGGSAFFLASICDLLGHGRIITIDIEALPDRPEHPRITYVHGSSSDPEVFRQVMEMVGDERPMVILDSDHSETHVANELRLWSPVVPVGGHLICEDTCVHGHPLYPEHGRGPMEALDAFLAECDDFERLPLDRKFLVSFNPRGYLRRVK